MASKSKIAATEIITSINPLVEEGRYYVFGNRKNPSKSQDLAIINGGYEIYKPNFELKRNSVPYYVIEFPVNGKCYLKINGEEIVLEKGIVAGYKPGDIHYYRCEPSAPLEHYFINFSGHQANKIYTETGIKSEHTIKIDEFEFYKKLMINILRIAFDKNIHSYELCHAYLKVFLLELCTHPETLRKTDSISKSTYIKCIKYIDKNYLEIISIEDIAEALNITSGYISKLFSKYCTTNAYRYLTSLKMTRASELLLTSMASVKKIAEVVGYKDQYHFSKSFKDFFNISPVNYRKKHLNVQ